MSATEDLSALNWPRVGLLPTMAAIESALDRGQGFSLIRLGDGEGAMLGHAEPDMAGEISFSLSIWFGGQSLGSPELAEITRDLSAAIAGADVIGLPRRWQAQGSPRYRAVFPPVATILGERRPLIVDAAFHFYLQWSGAVVRLLRRAERVVLVGCRDLAAEIERNFDVSTAQVLVQGEAQFPGAVIEPHWPDGYRRVLDVLSLVQPGTLVLVGAGVLGKGYCEIARQRGAVAVDIGSVLDGWADVRSRPGRIESDGACSLEALLHADYGDDQLVSRLHNYVAGTNITDGTV